MTTCPSVGDIIKIIVPSRFVRSDLRSHGRTYLDLPLARALRNKDPTMHISRNLERPPLAVIGSSANFKFSTCHRCRCRLRYANMLWVVR